MASFPPSNHEQKQSHGDATPELPLAQMGERRVLKVAVASKNPSKLESVRLALQRLLPADWPRPELLPVPVPSGVSDQPLSAEETLSGALNRARAALMDPRADGCEFGVGLEGGVEMVGGRAFESGYIAVLDTSGRTGVGTSARFWLADHILAELKSGKTVDEIDAEGNKTSVPLELAHIVDRLSGMDDVRSSLGMMGVITAGRLGRAECYSHGVIFAFAPWVSGGQWWDADGSWDDYPKDAAEEESTPTQ